MAMVRKIVNGTKIKHKDLDGVVKYYYPGEEIILSEEDASTLGKHLVDAGDVKNISKIVEDYTKGETISTQKHLQEVERVKKSQESNFIEMAEQKNKKIKGLEEHIQSLEQHIVSLKQDVKEATSKTDSAVAANYDKQLTNYEKIIDKQNKEILELQKTIGRLDKEVDSLKSLKSKK